MLAYWLCRKLGRAGRTCYGIEADMLLNAFRLGMDLPLTKIAGDSPVGGEEETKLRLVDGADFT